MRQTSAVRCAPFKVRDVQAAYRVARSGSCCNGRTAKGPQAHCTEQQGYRRAAQEEHQTAESRQQGDNGAKSNTPQYRGSQGEHSNGAICTHEGFFARRRPTAPKVWPSINQTTANSMKTKTPTTAARSGYVAAVRVRAAMQASPPRFRLRTPRP
jgi:hypothetical protein